MKQTGRDMVLWPGFCIVHEQFTAKRVAALKAKHPQAKHRPSRVRRHREPMADFVGSTAALLKFVRKIPPRPSSSAPRRASSTRCTSCGPTRN